MSKIEKSSKEKR